MTPRANITTTYGRARNATKHISMKQYTVKINRAEALRYLGYHGNDADQIVSHQLDEAITLLEQIAKPAYTYRIFDLIRIKSDMQNDTNPNPTKESWQIEASKQLTDDNHHSGPDAPKPFNAEKVLSTKIRLNGTSIVLSGSDTASFLKECHSCVMMAVTIGRRVDEELRRRQITDMSGAVILDSCASSAVESICNQIEADLEKEFESRSLFLTDRFSPGYGNLPLDLQPAICRTLSTEKTIGLSITGGMLMMPTKSVTAFIGIADRPQPKKLTGCARCRLNATCNYRKAGVTCAG